MVGIFLDFTRRTGHEHPHLRAALANYASILKAMGRSKPKIQAQLMVLQAEYGVKVEWLNRLQKPSPVVGDGEGEGKK
jgi:uncharacterized protein YcsI (UPF0317 family)